MFIKYLSSPISVTNPSSNALSKNEKKLSKSKLASLIYFQDRLKVGYVLKNVNQILLKVQKLNIMKSKFKKRIINLRKKRIKYLDKSLKKTHDEILNIIE